MKNIPKAGVCGRARLGGKTPKKKDKLKKKTTAERTCGRSKMTPRWAAGSAKSIVS